MRGPMLRGGPQQPDHRTLTLPPQVPQGTATPFRGTVSSPGVTLALCRPLPRGGPTLTPPPKPQAPPVLGAAELPLASGLRTVRFAN